MMSAETCSCMKMIKSECVYTSCYCEENVYKLAEDFLKNGLGASFAVFVSNDAKSVPILKQKSSSKSNGMVVWDYHVIFVHKCKCSGNISLVYDLDTQLKFPEVGTNYLDQSFLPREAIKNKYAPFFRAVPIESFLSIFASDRSHMIDKNGKYMSSPPNYRSSNNEQY